MSVKNSIDTIWDRTSDLAICSTASKPLRYPTAVLPHCLYARINLYVGLFWGKRERIRGGQRNDFAFRRIYPVVVYCIKIDMRASLSQNKFVLVDGSTHIVLMERLW
jgi:hypothetical protein